MARLPIVDPRAAHGAGQAAPAGRGDGGRRDLREEDLLDLLSAFYERVGREPLLQPYFAPVDMAAHLPRIADFWSTLLFHTGRYAGNAFRPHLEMPGLTSEHFARWLAALEDTVDERFAGPMAEQMKSLGHRVALSMQLRLRIDPSRPRGEEDARPPAGTQGG